MDSFEVLHRGMGMALAIWCLGFCLIWAKLQQANLRGELDDDDDDEEEDGEKIIMF